MKRNGIDIGMVLTIGSCRIYDAGSCLAICGYRVARIGPRVFTLPQISQLIYQLIDGKDPSITPDTFGGFKACDIFLLEVSSIREEIKGKNIPEAIFKSSLVDIIKKLEKPVVLVPHILCKNPLTGETPPRRIELFSRLESVALSEGCGFFNPNQFIDFDTMLTDYDHYNEIGTFAVAMALVEYLDKFKRSKNII